MTEMNPFVESTLKEWNLFDQLGEIFTTNDIDEETFKTLTNEEIKELIPKLGIRKKFLNKFNEFLIQDAQVVIQDDDSLSRSSDTSESAHQKLFYTEKATVGMPYVVEPVPLHNSTVKHLITTTEEGKLIKASYGPHKTFLRNKLSNLIIQNELKKSKDKRITSTRFFELAKEIYDYFPHENPMTYYVPYVKNDCGKPKAARGKLWNSYIYLRKVYKNLGVLSTEGTTDPCSSKDTDHRDENIEDTILFLKNHWRSQPHEIVKEKWIATFSYRNKASVNIEDYLNSYPMLREPLGYIWLELDFTSLYEDKSDCFYNKWPGICKNLIILAKEKKDSYMKALIADYESKYNKTIDHENLTDADNFFMLTLLPLFFTAVNLKCKKPNNRWKPSKIEIRQGFILHVASAADLEIQIELRRNKYQLYGFTDQPIPIIVGDYNNVEACYVKLNDIFYKVETFMKAIDITFKIYHALNAKYPSEAAIVWTFLESGVYEICTASTEKYVSVSTLISDLKKIN